MESKINIFSIMHTKLNAIVYEIYLPLYLKHKVYAFLGYNPIYEIVLIIIFCSRICVKSRQNTLVSEVYKCKTNSALIFYKH